jgi:predicted transcriptional regulator
MTIGNYNLEGDIKSKMDRLAQADDHPQIAIAESAVFATEAFLARLLEQRKFFRTDEYDDLINSTRELLSELVGRAVAQEEDDRINGSWNRACAAADFRRGL